MAALMSLMLAGSSSRKLPTDVHGTLYTADPQFRGFGPCKFVCGMNVLNMGPPSSNFCYRAVPAGIRRRTPTHSGTPCGVPLREGQAMAMSCSAQPDDEPTQPYASGTSPAQPYSSGRVSSVYLSEM